MAKTQVICDTPEWEALTRRRVELIRRHHDNKGLKPTEAAELAELDRQSQTALRLRFPSIKQEQSC